jgi:hypothetical protein
MYFVMSKGFLVAKPSVDRAGCVVHSTAVGSSMLLAILQPSKGQRDRHYTYNVACWRVRATVQTRKHDCITSALQFQLCATTVHSHEYC